MLKLIYSLCTLVSLCLRGLKKCHKDTKTLRITKFYFNIYKYEAYNYFPDDPVHPVIMWWQKKE